MIRYLRMPPNKLLILWQNCIEKVFKDFSLLILSFVNVISSPNVAPFNNQGSWLRQSGIYMHQDDSTHSRSIDFWKKKIKKIFLYLYLRKKSTHNYGPTFLEFPRIIVWINLDLHYLSVLLHKFHLFLAKRFLIKKSLKMTDISLIILNDLLYEGDLARDLN